MSYKKVRRWVKGHYRYVNRKRVWIRGYYIWVTILVPRKRR